MTLSRARELIEVQLQFSSGYNRNAVRMILGDVQREHGYDAVKELVEFYGLKQRFGLDHDMDYSRVGL